MKPLDSALWEMSLAFENLPDDLLWKRADPRLLSVGELAAHVAYGEIVSILGTFDSPFMTPAIRYYPYTRDEQVILPMNSEQVWEEVKRVHEASKSSLLSASPDPEAVNPHRTDWNWGYTLEYMAFHVAYHTGQIYSVLHLLGYETVDN